MLIRGQVLPGKATDICPLQTIMILMILSNKGKLKELQCLVRDYILWRNVFKKNFFHNSVVLWCRNLASFFSVQTKFSDSLCIAILLFGKHLSNLHYFYGHVLAYLTYIS